MELRYYQRDAVESAKKALDKALSPLLIMPCGAGKSLVIAELCRDLSKNNNILAITPRIKLLQQNAKIIHKAGIFSGKLGNDTWKDHKVICATYQTLLSRDHATPDIVIIDEAHLGIDDEHSSGYAQLLTRYKSENPACKFIGLTATPFKRRSHIADGVDSRWTKSYEIGMLPLIKQGYLVPPRSYRTHISVDKADDLFETTCSILSVAVEKLADLGRRKTLVFCQDIEHVKIAFTVLGELELPALMVHSEMKKRAIEASYNDFEKSESGFLVNCQMATIGVDFPFVDSLVLLRKFSEGGLYIQTLGRGLRAFPGKTDCVILDYFGNRRRFGAIDAPDFLKYSGLSSQSTRAMAPLAKEKVCPQCDLFNPVAVKVCRGCGTPFNINNVVDFSSTDINFLSIDIRKGVVSQIELCRSGSILKVKYTLTCGDTAYQFLAKNDADAVKIKKRIGSEAIYRVSNGVSRIINVS